LKGTGTVHARSGGSPAVAAWLLSGEVLGVVQ
jgi:hypothetical protein